jgi:predicted N-acetyltransferase YhbS
MPLTPAGLQVQRRASGPWNTDVRIRPMRPTDLDEADRVMRLAFGTFIGLHDPLTFMGDAAVVRPRWTANPSAAFVAEVDGIVVGSVFAAKWGSVGVVGPLTVRPDLWNRGIGHLLMEPVESLYSAWRTRLAGLFTFPHSPAHLTLYQKLGYRPRSLTAILSRPVPPIGRVPLTSRFSEMALEARDACLDEALELTGAIYDGLDLREEIRAVAAHGFGDTVLLHRGGRLDGLAVCHCGPGTEAGSGRCYIKFAAVRPGSMAVSSFDLLLTACGALASKRGATHLVAGVNTLRHEAYDFMLSSGFRIEQLGVVMHRPNEPGYSRPGFHVIDDWR